MINETVPAVVAEYRRDLHDMIVKKQYVPTADYLSRLLDRIEAAYNSSDGRRMQCAAPGDAAALREALDAAFRFIGNLEIEPYSPLDEAASELRQRIMDALSAPARQCDVGTAEEQAVRFRDMCNKYCDYENPCNEKCPLASLPIIHGFPRCQAYWAQMPYEAQEGAGK